MDLVNLVITPVVQSLMVPVKKHLGFFFSSTKYVKGMKEKMEQLSFTEQDIQEKRKTADANNHEISHHVSPWLQDVEKMKEKVQSVPTGGIGCFNVTRRYKAGKQSYTVLEQIKALKERESEIKWTNEQKSLAKVPSTSARVPHGTQSTFESRDLVLNDALQYLQSNDASQKMIALCGMGGVGKTTMMEQLKKAVEDSKRFDWVVKVVLGESVNLIALQRAIAEYIREDLTETTEDARADRLHQIFEGMSQKGSKKVLVIMDDLWKAFDLKDVGLSPLPNGFKLLFTSRFEHVCTQMGVRINSIFKVGFLNDVEAKKLFFGIVGLSDGDDPALQKIGEDIVKKCGGLPIAIVTMAKSLSGNIEEAWKTALWRLEKDDLEDLESITHRIFELSYKNLKKNDDKSIFLLSGLFPDDFEIRTEDLLRFGWGLGFFKDAKTLATARSHMKICVSNLLRANLFTKSDRMGCVRLHDLVRAFVLSIIPEVNQASIVNYDIKSEQGANESYERILFKCTGMTNLPPNFKYPNLSLLMLMDGKELLKFPEDIYKRMEKLEVVSYENMHIPLLPGSFEHSIKLRTLCLRSCSFINDDVSLIGSLSNLESLSFINCEIRRLPSAIGKLKKLKLLDLTGCVHLRIDDGIFENLSSLEELYMRSYNRKSIKFTDTNCDELEILSRELVALEMEFFQNKPQPKNVSFKNLQRFRISIGCLLELEDDEEDSFRNTIQFVGDCNELLECNISDLFEKTEDLYLDVKGMKHLEDVSMHYSFSTLKVLDVYNCQDLTYLFTVDVASGLKRLERLTISNCPVMRTLIAENSRVGVIRFHKLNFMSLKCLPKMVSFSDNVIDLPEMMELILDDLPNFTSIYPNSHNTSEMQSLLNKKVVIPQLEELDISRMENLKHIWSCETIEKNNVSMLRNIVVRECDNLVNLLACNPFPLLNHLEELEVKDCGSIEVLFNMEFESICGTGEYVSNKLISIRVDNLGKLKELWRVTGVINPDIRINCFKCVESIVIDGCSIFKNIFTPTTTNFDMGALTEYIIENTNAKMNLKEEISEMDNYIPNVSYPSYFLQKFHQLEYLLLQNDERVGEVVFEIDCQPPLLLPYLQDLHLYYLKEMTHVWKCNWNKFLIPQHQPLQFPFQNLTEIYLRGCHKVKYLFSPLMAIFLSNLKYVSIKECNGMEEVVSWRYDAYEENTSTFCQRNTILFPCLETLVLQNLTHLNRVDGGDTLSRSDTISSNIVNTSQHQSQGGQVIGACWSLCQYPRKIVINDCPRLSILIPWYAVGQMNRLEELEISNCKRMMEVFQCEMSTNNVDEGSAHGGASTALTSQTLKTIPSVVSQLSNLKSVYISGCHVLEHVFAFSTLESLKQLRNLRVHACYSIQVIVKEENGMSSKDVVFPRLETLILDYLPSLKGFSLGKNDFRWPSLDYVKMSGHFPQLMMFTSGESKTPKLKYIYTMLGKHSLECGLNFHGMINEFQTNFPSSSDVTILQGMPCSFHNLIELNNSYDPTIIPSHALPQLQKLQKICIRGEIVKEVFEVKALEGSDFNESQTLVKIPNLTQVELVRAYSLKYLWKSNPWMVLEFPNLTTVSIEECDSLEHVFTCSMVASLVQLQHLSISYCRNIEVIVKEEEECDDEVNDIMLPNLKLLKLLRLPRLEVFTEGYLSTPRLKVINTKFGNWYVKTDVNSFIKTKQEEGYKF